MILPLPRFTLPDPPCPSTSLFRSVTKPSRQPPRPTAVFTPFARIAPPLQSCRFCLPPEGASMSTAALDASNTPRRATAAFGWLGATLLAERGRWPLWLPVLLGAGVAAYFASPEIGRAHV